MARVIIQMGHCFRTSGATGTGGLDADPTEQEFAHAAADLSVVKLRALGHDARSILADAPNSAYGPADLFVAIHCDGSTSPSAAGASVGYRNNLGADAAGRWKASYAEAGWSGGWRPDNYTAALAGYYGVRKAVAAGTPRAFICEAGFLTNPGNEAALSFPHGPDRFARSLADTVAELFGGATPPEDWFDMATMADLLAALDQHDRQSAIVSNLVTAPTGDMMPMADAASYVHQATYFGWLNGQAKPMICTTDEAPTYWYATVPFAYRAGPFTKGESQDLVKRGIACFHHSVDVEVWPVYAIPQWVMDATKLTYEHLPVE